MTGSTFVQMLALLVLGAALALSLGLSVIYCLRKTAFIGSPVFFFLAPLLAIIAMLAAFILVYCGSLWSVYISFCVACLFTGATISVISLASNAATAKVAD